MMEAIMNEIVTTELSKRAYMVEEKLEQYTRRTQLDQIGFDCWNRVEHLYIDGTAAESKGQRAFGTVCYSNSAGTWFLVRQATLEQVGQIIAACSERLEKLDIRFTGLTQLRLSHLSGLHSLCMVKNTKISEVQGMERLTGLKELVLNNSAIGSTLDVSGFREMTDLYLRDLPKLQKIQGIERLENLQVLHLERLGMGGTLELYRHPSLEVLQLGMLSVRRIHLQVPLSALRECTVSAVKLEDAGFVQDLPGLEALTLCRTAVNALPDLNCCPHLKLLNLEHSPVEHLDGLPEGIRDVVLSSTRLSRVPEFIRDLRHLEHLYLEDLTLEELPAWLPELGLPITADQFSKQDGIVLGGTCAEGVNIHNLIWLRNEAQPHADEKIRCWFASRGKQAPPVLAEYDEQPDVLDFQMEYDRLEESFFLRLWAQLWEDTDTDCIWEKGVRFVDAETLRSAVVSGTGNTLRFLVRRSEKSSELYEYMCQIRKTVDRVAAELEMRCEKSYFMYKLEGITNVVPENTILMYRNCKMEKMPLPLMMRSIPIDDILNQNNRPVNDQRNDVLDTIIDKLQDLQNTEIYRDTNEDSYNQAVLKRLTEKDWIGKDQSQSGTSGAGSGVGRPDGVVNKYRNKPWTFYEGVILKGKSNSEKANWNEHLDRLINNYDPYGVSFSILASYVKCPKPKFHEIFNEFYKHCELHEPKDHKLISAKEMNLDYQEHKQNELIRCVRATYERGGYRRDIYHIFARFGT